MILIALGSNINGPWGGPKETVQRALVELPKYNIRIRKISQLLETAPFGVTNQPTFINAVAVVETALPPETLMRALHMIERRAGRKRQKRWGPRTLDLDLLDYHGQVRNAGSRAVKPLKLPHPGILQRQFVLLSLVEVAPHWRHPISHVSAELTLRQLQRLNRP
jgi:2-amino-4-hydroxy-6-hydroxymethyldihydropteridine diphosphokinase